jgi:hypothetical protein
VSYFEKISESLSDLKTTNTKMYWRTIKQLLKEYSPTYILPPICAHENDTVYKFEDQEKTQLLNDYFCSIATLDNDNKDIPYMTERGPGILTEINITEQDIHDIISCLDPQKASGPDDISHRMLIATKNTICRPRELFNLSLRKKCFRLFGNLLTLQQFLKNLTNRLLRTIDQYRSLVASVKFLRGLSLNMLLPISVDINIYINFSLAFSLDILLHIN